MLHLSSISHQPRLALPTLIYTPLSLHRYVEVTTHDLDSMLDHTCYLKYTLYLDIASGITRAK